MSRFSSDLPLEVTSGLQRLVSIVDEQRPSGTPAALQVLNFDFSSKSGIDLLRGALGVGGDSEVVIAVSALNIPADEPRQLLVLEKSWRKAGCEIIWVLPPNKSFVINGVYASLDQTARDRVGDILGWLKSNKSKYTCSNNEGTYQLHSGDDVIDFIGSAAHECAPHVAAGMLVAVGVAHVAMAYPVDSILAPCWMPPGSIGSCEEASSVPLFDRRRWLEYAGIDILTLALLISLAWPAFVDDYNEYCSTELSLGRFLAALCCSFKIVSSQLADSPTIQNNVDLSELNFSAVFEKTAEVAHNHQQGENWKIEPPVDASSDVKAAFDTTNIVLAIVARDGVKYEEWEGRAIGYHNAAKLQFRSE